MEKQLMYMIADDTMQNGLSTGINKGSLFATKELDITVPGFDFEKGVNYVIVHPNAIMIAQASYSNKKAGLINCHLLNPEYADFQMQLSSIEKILKITHVLNKAALNLPGSMLSKRLLNLC